MTSESDRKCYLRLQLLIQQSFEEQAARIRETIGHLNDDEIRRGIAFLNNVCERMKIQHQWKD